MNLGLLAAVTTNARVGVRKAFDKPIGFNVNDLIDDWDMDTDFRSIPTLAMLLFVADEALIQKIPQANPAAGNAPEYTTRGGATVNGLIPSPAADDEVFFNALLTFYADVGGPVLDLVACHQVRRLNAGNVISYFASLSNTAVDAASIVPILHVLASVYPILAGNAAVAHLMSNGDFIGYHTSYSSTAALIRRMIDDMGADIGAILSPATIATVNASLADPSNKALNAAIPSAAIAATHYYLDAFGALPGGWYQGQKAVAATAAFLRRKYIVYFRRYAEIRTDDTAAQAAPNVITLNTLGYVQPI